MLTHRVTARLPHTGLGMWLPGRAPHSEHLDFWEVLLASADMAGLGGAVTAPDCGGWGGVGWRWGRLPFLLPEHSQAHLPVFFPRCGVFSGCAFAKV